MAIVIQSTDSNESVQAALQAKNPAAKVEVTDDLEDTNSSDVVQSTGAKQGDPAVSDDSEGSTADSATVGSKKEPDTEGSKAQKRIEQLIRENGELKGKLEATASKPADKKVEPKPDVPETEPKSEDFDTQGDYLKALSKWAAKEARREQKAEDAKVAEANKGTQTIEAWKKQVEIAKAKYNDWDTVMGDVEIGTIAARVLIGVPDGAELSYYIGKHPERAGELVAATNERDVAMIIGELRAEVKAAAPKDGVKPKPKPINPVGNNSSGNVEKQPQEMTYKEYKAKRNKDIAAKRKSA